MDIEKICSRYCEIIENSLREQMAMQEGVASVLKESIEYSLLSGGKRIRPILLMEFYRLYKDDIEKVYPYACAVEMIHTYSLIHDDLPCMDNDTMRRGKATNHIVYGEDISLLAGDALITEAFGIMLDANTVKSVGMENAIKAAKILADYAGTGGMITGQVFDIKMNEREAERETILNMYRLKTGALLSASSKMGLALAGADDRYIEAAGEYGKYLGLAFQIVDDILDVNGNEEITGKKIGRDETNNKKTYVSMFGINSSRKLVFEFTDKAIDALKIFRGDTSFLKGFAEALACRIK